ncbi:MAG: IS66 family transposase, partial [Ardenticatenaceae bacterium]
RLPVARRQVCWAHLKRDLTAFREATGAAGAWGERALAVEAQLFALWHRFKQGELDRATLQQQRAAPRATFQTLLQAGERILHY